MPRPKTIRDRRRFKESIAPSGSARAALTGNRSGSIFPNKVIRWTPETGETILKDGAHNRKIGGDVLVGDLRGAHIVTLSFEERVTCPTTCAVWSECYGNNMRNARRWQYSRDLVEQLEHEIDRLCAKHPGVLVRLHVLGDFPEREYIDFWDRMLTKHRNLFCFGFTAHKPDTVGGDLIRRVREKHVSSFAIKSRFAIRHSNTPGEWGSMVVKEVPNPPTNKDRVICLEQLDAIDGSDKKMHCGSCAVCWQSTCNVQFLEH